MQRKQTLKELKSCLKHASPAILTFTGAAGVVVTAISAVKAAPKAMWALEEEEKEKREKLTKWEIFYTTTPAYIPTVLFGGFTIACIFGVNILNRKQQASLMSAYALVNNAYYDYKNKVKELCGEETHKNIINSMVKEKAENTHILSQSFFGNASLDFGEGNEPIKLFYDAFSERYFESTIGRVLQSEYHLNRNFILYGYVSLNNFYEFLGLEQTDYGDTVGWSSFNGDIYWIDFNHYKKVLKDRSEIFVVETIFAPDADWLEDV